MPVANVKISYLLHVKYILLTNVTLKSREKSTNVHMVLLLNFTHLKSVGYSLVLFYWWIWKTVAWSGRDRMVVGFTNTYAISAYHH